MVSYSLVGLGLIVLGQQQTINELGIRLRCCRIKYFPTENTLED